MKRPKEKTSAKKPTPIVETAMVKMTEGDMEALTRDITHVGELLMVVAAAIEPRNDGRPREIADDVANGIVSILDDLGNKTVEVRNHIEAIWERRDGAR